MALFFDHKFEECLIHLEQSIQYENTFFPPAFLILGWLYSEILPQKNLEKSNHYFIKLLRI